MVKILYGLAGEGMGHATRSKVVLTHLKEKGHNVHIVASNKAFDFISSSFKNATKIPGPTLVYEDNTLKALKSVVKNFIHLEGREAVKRVRKIIREEQPDLIITDYEFTVAYLAGIANGKTVFHKKKIPLLSIDNMHVISNCKIEVPKEYKRDYLLVKYVNDLIVPPKNVNKFLVTSFFFPPVVRKNTFFIPSLLREEIVKAKVGEGNHILVYQTSKSNLSMLDLLKKVDEKFIVYGFGESKGEGNLTFKPFSETGFVEDLASCKAAITNGGFSMISEAIFLHKPVLSVPIKHHFEQICNALYLQREGYGEFHEELTLENVQNFLANLKKYKGNLERYSQKDNQEAFALIDRLIKECLKK